MSQTQFHTQLPEELLVRLRQASKDRGIPMARLVQKAVEVLLDVPGPR